MVVLIPYIASLAAFLGLDMVWLGIMAPRLYRSTMGDIALSSAALAPAAIFYFLYPMGLVFFAVQPSIRNGNWPTAAVHGALFGFFTYATYDLTNQATLRNWSTLLSITDVAWGTFLGAASSLIAFFATVELTSIK